MAPKRILIVEDEKDIALKGKGFDVLKTVVSFKPDLVLLDVMMPVKSGFERNAKFLVIRDAEQGSR